MKHAYNEYAITNLRLLRNDIYSPIRENSKYRIGYNKVCLKQTVFCWTGGFAIIMFYYMVKFGYNELVLLALKVRCNCFIVQ